jgi:hypothetical protein
MRPGSTPTRRDRILGGKNGHYYKNLGSFRGLVVTRETARRGQASQTLQNFNYRAVGPKIPTFPVRAFGRSRPAADASREVVERWLLDDLM